jgi:DNA-binding FrmR family transcriptional regulator
MINSVLRRQGSVMDERTKAVITQRLASTTGHLRGIEGMVGQDAYCLDLIRQIQAVQSALDKVSVIMLTTYVDVCLLAAVWAKDIAERERMLREVAGVFRVLKKHNYSIEGEFKRMETKTFTVPNISCGGCTHTIERVAVEWKEPATWEKIQSRLQDINYPPEGLIQLN